MNKELFSLFDKMNSNNNLLLKSVNNLLNILKNINDNSIIKKFDDEITKINCIINESNKINDLIKNDVSKLYKLTDELKLNNKINQELECINGKYVGQVVNGLREGKGIYYLLKEPFKGDRYEGDWKNDKREGKGMENFNDGDIYIGDFKKGALNGKGIMYYNNGDRYEDY